VRLPLDGSPECCRFSGLQAVFIVFILFKGKVALESAAGIKLHQADGTIIRNIIIESSGDEAPKDAILLRTIASMASRRWFIPGTTKVA
jgi:hypothetical protein